MKQLETNDNAIEVSDFIKKFWKKKIGPISFSVKSGTLHALIGASGSGKTVILKSIVKGIKKHKGDIKFNNSTESWKVTKKRIGYIPEFLTFPDNISAYNFIYQLGKLYGLDKNYLQKEITRLMKFFDIWAQKDKNVNSFSSGMKKRVMIIQGIIHNPDIIILDEPDSGLDTDNRIKLFMYLKRLVMMKKTILICTHMIDEIIPFIDDFTLINNGQEIYTGGSAFIKKQLKFHFVVNQPPKLIDYLVTKNIRHEILKNNHLIIFTKNYFELLVIYSYCLRNSIKVMYLKQIQLTLKELENMALLQYANLEDKKNDSANQEKTALHS